MLLLNQTQTLISMGKNLVFKKKNVVWALVAGVGLHPVGRGRPESLLQQFLRCAPGRNSLGACLSAVLNQMRTFMANG